jgi:hypothetical protein
MFYKNQKKDSNLIKIFQNIPLPSFVFFDGAVSQKKWQNYR